MFVQIIQGKAADREGLLRQGERWRDELRPGAAGFLGSTMGISPDGTAFLMARFEDEASARANERRTEQAQWWTETEKYYAGPPTFVEGTDVSSFLAGGSDDAGFVQVIRARTPDRAALTALEDSLEDRLRSMRPEVIGGLRIWLDDHDFIQVVYFSSETEARQGEQREVSQEGTAEFEEWDRLLLDPTFLDLPEPVMV